MARAVICDMEHRAVSFGFEAPGYWLASSRTASSHRVVAVKKLTGLSVIANELSGTVSGDSAKLMAVPNDCKDIAAGPVDVQLLSTCIRRSGRYVDDLVKLGLVR